MIMLGKLVDLGHDGIGTTICLDSAEEGIRDARE